MLLLLLLFTCSLSAGCVPSTNRKHSAARVYNQNVPAVHQSVIRTRATTVQPADPEGEAETMRLHTAITVLLNHYRQEEQREASNNGSTTSRRPAR